MEEKFDFIDEFLAHCEDWMHDKGGRDCTTSRKFLIELREQLNNKHESNPTGDVEILLKGLEHIAVWGDEQEDRWDDQGECAMDTITQYRYSIKK